MTDNDIIKALECCISSENCDICPKYSTTCIDDLMKQALDLINHQKAEIERLTVPKELIDDDYCGVVCEFAEELIEKAKAEAVKEFAEKVKGFMDDVPMCSEEDFIYVDYFELQDKIDNLVKEVAGDTE